MGIVHVLDSETINQIAAGEVIERPASVVKELVENAVDSGATQVTVEIEGGGVTMIRVTDNGSGFAAEDIRTAFLRHATSKISCGEDLFRIHSLGFRGEALSSIASVAKVELLTMHKDAYIGSRYRIEGGVEVALEEAGCPQGSTMLVYDLFYNVPARRKFLKSTTTEAGYCNELLSRFALAHPEVSITFISQGRTILHTSGNGKLQDTVFAVFGRETASNLLPVSYEGIGITVGGYIGNSYVTRSNRGGELCFVNGRDVRDKTVRKATEDAFHTYVMQHKYPVTMLTLTVRPDLLDVNIHPTKSEVRFLDPEEVYHAVTTAVRNALTGANLIRNVSVDMQEKEVRTAIERPPESFEKNRSAMSRYTTQEPSSASLEAQKTNDSKQVLFITEEMSHEAFAPYDASQEARPSSEKFASIDDVFRVAEEYANAVDESDVQQDFLPISAEAIAAGESIQDEEFEPDLPILIPKQESFEQEDDSEEKEIVTGEQLSFLDESQPADFRIVGQVFNTYWIIELDNQMLMIDQHAAHEKINYERLLTAMKNGEVYTQQMNPPHIVKLSIREEEMLAKNAAFFEQLGFEIRDLGGREYGIFGVPSTLYRIAPEDYFAETLSQLMDTPNNTDPIVHITERLASMSCKAAIKGGQRISDAEAKHLISELLTLENPFHCPHGRPIIISISRQEMERKFKRIV
ncbi:MAG: DNA mismatch repair endonuclease MutL [Lachnospiraceae bacterium]|nr:DNA mismatch repair endonuclease MutL [Lachnospiraceae bacterium]